MHGCGFEEMVLYLIIVCDWPDDDCTDVLFAVEALQPAPDTGVCVFDEFGFYLCVGGGGLFEVGGGGFGVDPDFYFHGTGAVIKFVGVVCGLGGDVAYLTYEGDL